MALPRDRDSLDEHWDSRYAAGESRLSWFQESPRVSLDLIASTGVGSTEPVVDVGGGAGRLADHLVADGWSDVTVVDISEVALATAQARLADSGGVHWVCADVRSWAPQRCYRLWHDRAVFHFLVEEDDRQVYRDRLAAGLAVGGVLIIATFAKDGPTHCSGLPVARYDSQDLLAALGGSFEVLAERREEHLTPTGAVQPFTWLALRKNAGTTEMPR